MDLSIRNHDFVMRVCDDLRMSGFLAVPTEFDNEIRAYLKSVL